MTNFAKVYYHIYIAVKMTTTSQMPQTSCIKRLSISIVHFKLWSYHKSLSNTYCILHMIHQDILEPWHYTISSKDSTTFKVWERKYINMFHHVTNARSWIYKNPTLSTYIKILHEFHRTTYPLTHYDPTMSHHKVTLIHSLQFATSQVDHDDLYQR